MPGRLHVANPIDLGGDAGEDPFAKFKAKTAEKRGENLTARQRELLKRTVELEEPWNEDEQGTIYGLDSVDF